MSSMKVMFWTPTTESQLLPIRCGLFVNAINVIKCWSNLLNDIKIILMKGFRRDSILMNAAGKVFDAFYEESLNEAHIRCN